MKYVFPAIFAENEDGFSIRFPDVEGCFTCSETLGEGIEMAEDALALMLYEYEKEGRTIPSASSLKSIETDENEFVTYITCDTLKYRKMHNNRAVKKTLTIPEWLNEEATAHELNFSQILQEALRLKLNLE